MTCEKIDRPYMTRGIFILLSCPKWLCRCVGKIDASILGLATFMADDVF
jgi:hypothetical protein